MRVQILSSSSPDVDDAIAAEIVESYDPSKYAAPLKWDEAPLVNPLELAEGKAKLRHRPGSSYEQRLKAARRAAAIKLCK